jgi:hypothetical protein
VSFRAEVRDWLAAHVPAAPLPSLDTAEGFEAHRAWERELAAARAARAALQVHGAIGYTAEHDLSRFLLQVRALVPAWGTQAEHRARVLRELGP